jgi:flagellar biosynthetic protein FliP
VSLRRLLPPLLLALAGLLAVAPQVAAQTAPAGGVVIDAPGGGAGAGVQAAQAESPVGITLQSQEGGLSRTVLIVLLLTVGSVAPGILLLMTSFTRFIVVLGLAKNAIGVHTIPPAQVLVGLALFLTFFVMGPVLSEVNDEAIQPMLAGTISQDQAWARGFAPLRTFMMAQTRESDLELFANLADDRAATRADVSARVLVPAFVISELRTAFIIGFVIFVPFLVIDFVVSAVLMSMGMMMLPPVFISLPLKLLLFILVDGWALIVGSLVGSVQGAIT